MPNDEVTRATTELYTNGQTEHITVPRPLRSLLKWKKRESLIVIMESPDRIVVMSLDSYMRDIVAADRRARPAADVEVPR
jgi:bifunctional DNA-binding transcriptional regulator/antitoxin component of YhaV-PrlF toxin-antitoxin module